VFGAALAHMRFAISVGFGLRFDLRALDRVVDAIGESHREFGPLDAQGREALTPPMYTPDERRDMQLSRLRRLAKSAARETAYYEHVFDRVGVSPGKLSWDDVARLPLTTKRALRDRPEAFVARSSRPVLAAETTGTTGRPTRIYFSAYDLAVLRALGTIGLAGGGLITERDVLFIATSPRAIGNLNIGPAAARIGATVHLTGMPEPCAMLAMLTAPHGLPGKHPRPSVLSAYPSYLGALTEAARASGHRPDDFGLLRIFTGGELVTAGLQDRVRRLFGDVSVSETYAMTETLPFGGRVCSAGHLHFESTHGLVELLDPLTGERAPPGALAKIVATPLPPYRETTLILRYDTDDAVTALAEEPQCELRQLPATSSLRGKLAACVRLDDGVLVSPRSVAEALEGSRHVPLPARYSVVAQGRRVFVEAVVRDAADARVHGEIGDRLIDAGVPLHKLRLVDDGRELRSPPQLRGDLREPGFPTQRDEGTASAPDA
jgi:phenylacetate-CoA ligase